MNWPEDMTPERTPVYARNEMVIPAEPERVWSWLVHAKQWPEWYSNCSWIRLSTEELGPASEFTWKTFGVALHSKVHVFEPGVAIEWDARGPAGIRAYHGWRIDFDGHESHVVTEETQAGPFISLGRWFLTRRLLRGHQLWVESLKKGGDEREADLKRSRFGSEGRIRVATKERTPVQFREKFAQRCQYLLLSVEFPRHCGGLSAQSTPLSLQKLRR